VTGERNLHRLLASLAPELIDGEYVFCTFADGRYADHVELAPLAAMVEREGLTLLIPRSKADAHELPYESVFKGITLGVHSSLDAVGLTAAVAGQLTECGISANVIAGYYHDHVFVPLEQAANALEALSGLAEGQARRDPCRGR